MPSDKTVLRLSSGTNAATVLRLFSRTDRGTTPRVASEENGARRERVPPLGFHPGVLGVSRVTGIIAAQWAKSLHSRPLASSSTAAILLRE